MLVDPREFRALDENARLLRPLVVWELKSRSARDGKQCRNWRLGARLGPDASGLYSQMVSDLGATPPGIRKAGFREVMEVLRRPGQVGYPPNVATDAQLGFSVMASQSAEVFSPEARRKVVFWSASREPARGPAKAAKQDTWPNGRRWATAHVAPTQPARRRRPVTWRESIPGTKPMGSNCRRGAAPGRFVILLLRYMRATPDACPPNGVGLLSPWR